MKSEPVSFKSDGIRINGTLFTSDNISPAVCVCHGIPRVAKPVEQKGYPDLADRLVKLNLSSLIFNFRGSPGSAGDFSLRGWSKDLSTAIDFLRGRKEINDEIGLVGFSAGAIVSIYNAARDERIKFLAACSAPARVPEIVSSEKGFDPIRWIGNVSCPVLFLHGKKDELIDPSDAFELYNVANHPKQIKIIDDAGHRIRQNREAMDELVRWLKWILR